MHDFMLQDWTTVEGGANLAFVQDRSGWLDLVRHSEMVFFLEVRSVRGSVSMRYQTAPALDDSLFGTAASAAVIAGSSPIVTRVALASASIPVGRFVRWMVEPLDSNPWAVTFRVWAVAGTANDASPTPSGLALTGWWRAAFTGSPWIGTESAGTSAGRELAQDTSPPTVGASLGGYATADFDGVNDTLAASSAASSYCTTTTFSGWALVNIDAINTNDTSGAPAANDTIFSTNGTNQHFLYLRSAGPTVGMYIFPVADRKVETGITTGSWQLIQFKADGTNIFIRVNGDAWASAVGGTINSLAATYRIGINTLVNQFFDGRLAELAFSQEFFSDATFDDVRNYINVRYGLSV